MDIEAGYLLVVDDNEMNRDMLSRRLARRGHTVDLAEDGARALESIAANDYDVVLLDIMMPGIDGYEVLERVRQIIGPSELPIIMATAKDASDNVVKALKMGANDYVTKPLDFQVVQARVNTQLALKRSQAALRVAHARMKHDLDAAAKFQKSMLPSAAPETTRARFAWRYEACDELAGDALNVFAIDERTMCVYLIDVSGHGVSSSLLSVTVNRNLAHIKDASSLVTRPSESAPGYTIAPPQQVAAQLNALYPMARNSHHYFTMIFGTLDTTSGRFDMVNAGHPWPLQVGRGDRVVDLESDETNYPIGMIDDAEYAAVSTTLEPGDRLYLFSDGLTEAINDTEEQFGEPRLLAAARQAFDKSLDDSITELIAAASAWQGGRAFDDDISVLAIEMGG